MKTNIEQNIKNLEVEIQEHKQDLVDLEEDVREDQTQRVEHELRLQQLEDSYPPEVLLDFHRAIGRAKVTKEHEEE